MRIFDLIGIQAVDLRPEERVAEIFLGESPECIAFLDHVRALRLRLLRTERCGRREAGDKQGE